MLFKNKKKLWERAKAETRDKFGKDPWFRFEMKKKDAPELLIFNEIGFWGTTAESFHSSLKEISDAPKLKIRLNSPGGDVFDGFSIFNMLNEFKGEIEITIDGFAASIASVIAMAGDKIKMPSNTFLMIHNPTVYAGGESADLRKMAELLDDIKEKAIDAYMLRAKDVTREEISKLMDDTTWMTADDAISMGFADELTDDEVDPDNLQNFGKLQNVPEEVKMLGMKIEPQIINNGEGDEPEPNQSNEDDNSSQNEGDTMTEEEMKAALEAQKTENIAKFSAVSKSLRGSAASLKVEDSAFIDGLILSVVGGEKTEAAAKDEVILKHQEKQTPIPGDKTSNGPVGAFDIKHDEHDKYVECMSHALCMGAGMKVDDEKKAELRKQGVGPMRLKAFLRDFLARNGERNVHILDGEELYRRVTSSARMAFAEGSDDLSNILANTANKAMIDAWTEAPTTYQRWTGGGSVQDFKTNDLVKMSPFSDVEEIVEGEGFRYGRVADAKETVQVKTYGKAFSLSRQAIINDDMNAFTRLPASMADASRRNIDRKVYDLLVSAAFAGPTMNEDSVALFNATTHGNYKASGGAVPSIATISAGEIAMMTRPLLSSGDKKSGSVYTEIAPRGILVPTSLKTTAEQVIRSPRDTTASNDSKFNPYTALDVVSSAYLNSKSAARWYLFGDPRYGTIGVYTLSGYDVPTARSRTSDVGEPLGISWDIYFDFNVVAEDWRYLYQNIGA